MPPQPPNKPREEPFVPESPKLPSKPASTPGISPAARTANLSTLKERERVSRLQEEHLGNFLVRMKATQEPERARLREELKKIADIEKLRIANVSFQENHADYHLKHLKLASSYLEISEPPQNQNGHMEFIVDFHGNENAEWKVGAAHCLPPEITAIAVYDEHGELVASRAFRGIKDGRVGYFDEETGEYAHIHSGYRIEVLETGGSSDEKVKTRMAEEKEFFEKDAKKAVLKESLAKFFQAKELEVVIDDIYFEREFDEILEEASREAVRANPNELFAVFENFFNDATQNLIANFNLAGIKDLTLSDLPELLGNPEFKLLQAQRFAQKEDLPPNLSEHLVPREVDPNEPFVITRDNFGNKVTLRKTAGRMFDRAVAIASSMGVKLKVASSYRDVEDQKHGVERHIAKHGFRDPRLIALPGHSPHHTGGTIDVWAYRGEKSDQSLLKEILPRCGFKNYPVEDWHWEFGTARWRREQPGARGGTYAKVLDRDDIVHV